MGGHCAARLGSISISKLKKLPWVTASSLFVIALLILYGLPIECVTLSARHDLQAVPTFLEERLGNLSGFSEQGLSANTCWGAHVDGQTDIAIVGIRNLTLLPIVLNNDNGYVTPQFMPMYLNLNVSQFSSISASGAANVEFFDVACNPLHSWVQSISSLPWSALKVWVRLDFQMPAYSEATIWAAIYPVGAHSYGGTITGEAPGLSPRYGEFDNGAQVFEGYWNFNGTSLPSDWLATLPFVVNDGITVAMNNSSGEWVGTLPMYAGGMVDFYGEFEVPNLVPKLDAAVGFARDAYLGVYQPYQTLALNGEQATNATDYTFNQAAVFSIGTVGNCAYTMMNMQDLYTQKLANGPISPEQIGIFTQITSGVRVWIQYMDYRQVPLGFNMPTYHTGNSTVLAVGESISPRLSYGAYSFTVFSDDAVLHAAPTSGEVVVDKTGYYGVVKVHWLSSLYRLLVQENGLPYGVGWGIWVRNSIYSTNNSSLSILLPNATYLVQPEVTGQFVPFPTSFNITIDGGAAYFNVSYQVHSGGQSTESLTEWVSAGALILAMVVSLTYYMKHPPANVRQPALRQEVS